MEAQTQQRETALRLCSAMNEADVDKFASCLSDKNFRQKYLPKSVGPEAQSSGRSKSEVLEVLKGTFEHVVLSMNVTITRMIHGKDELMLLLHDIGKGRNGKNYDLEYILMMRFDEDHKISEIVEFQDSHYIQVNFLGWFAEATK